MNLLKLTKDFTGIFYAQTLLLGQCLDNFHCLGKIKISNAVKGERFNAAARYCVSRAPRCHNYLAFRISRMKLLYQLHYVVSARLSTNFIQPVYHYYQSSCLQIFFFEGLLQTRNEHVNLL